jgi:hypothetical protein
MKAKADVKRRVRRAQLLLPPPERAGYTVEDWCAAIPIGRTLFYELPPEIVPRSIKIAARTIVVEAPTLWLARIAAMGGLPKFTRKAARAAA